MESCKGMRFLKASGHTDTTFTKAVVCHPLVCSEPLDNTLGWGGSARASGNTDNVLASVRIRVVVAVGVTGCHKVRG